AAYPRRRLNRRSRLLPRQQALPAVRGDRASSSASPPQSPLLRPTRTAFGRGASVHPRRRLALGGDIKHAGPAQDLDGPLAIPHAGMLVPESLLRLLAVIVVELLRIGHLHGREILVIQLELLILCYVVEEQDVGRQCIKLIGRKRLGVAERHGSADVVEERRRIGPERADGLVGAIVLERAQSAGERRPAILALAELTMAGRALGLENLLALRDRALTLGQALAVGANINVPGGDLRRSGLAADAELACGSRSGERHCENRREPELTKLRHSRSLHSGARARSGCRCCDRLSGRRAP